ncbi:uncharacterized protein LOC127870455 [Dreissena polymorpha]|nr:uncharacterized protein LOC127870455 [Dreissena polymorpha]
MLFSGRQCTFVELPRVAKTFCHDADFSNLPLKLKDMLTLLENTMHELSEEEKLVKRDADAVKMTIKDCSDTLARLIDKLQDQAFEAVEKLKTSITKDILTQKKLCESFHAKLESICNVVADERVDDTTAFIGLTKGKTLLSSARQLITDTEARLRCGIEFHTDKELHKMLSQMQYFGTVNSIERKFRLAEKSEVNITLSGDTTPRCDITAMCELPNGMLVLVDAANSKLKVFNESLQHLSQRYLTSPPLDMCVIGESELAVVTCGEAHFYIVNESGLGQEKSIKISNQSTGIAYFDFHLFVARKTALYKYSLDGKINKRIYKDGAAGGKVTMSRCAIGRDGKYIYVTGPDCQGLLILDISGNRLAFIKHNYLYSPQGLHVAPGGQVFVCGTGSQTVMQLDREWSRLVMVADGDNGLTSPRSVVLSNRKSCLIIGQEATEKILVFRVT